MPTAAKLVAAICFALVGLLFAREASGYFPDATPPKWFVPILFFSGAWAGVVFCGRRARGLSSGIGTGLTAAIAIPVVGFFVSGFLEMLSKSLRRAYEGPMDALLDVVQMMVDYMSYSTNAVTIGILIGGGIVAGAMTGFLGWKYPR